MTRAYLRLDPGYDERKAAYPDGPYATLIACICLGESQPHRGRFRSERFLRSLLEKRARWVPYLVSHGDLLVLDDGRLYVDGWDEWQEGDWKVMERVERIRNKRRNKRTVDVTVGVTVATVSPPRDALSDSGAVLSAVMSGALQPPLSDEEQREHLEHLRASIAGVVPLPAPKDAPRPNGPDAETDEARIARYRAIADDEDEPEWRRIAAKSHLETVDTP
jgi:hypothetical protein